jgi:dolichol kinase
VKKVIDFDFQNVSYFSRKQDLHLARKIWHFATGFLGIILYFKIGFSLFYVGVTCVALALIFFMLDFIRLRSEVVNKVFCKTTRWILRDSEVNQLAGHSFYALGVGLSLLLFEKDVALLSILFLVFADPLSSLIGGVYGREKFLPNKSIEGSLTCFIVCYALSFFFLKSMGYSGTKMFVFSLIAGVVGSFSELISAFKVDDNLTIPVVSGIGLTLLNNYFLLL